MSADIVTLPGVERHDIGPVVPVEEVLRNVATMELETIIVIGYGRDGWYLSASSPDMDRNIGMLARAQHEMLHCEPCEIIAGEDAGA